MKVERLLLLCDMSELDKLIPYEVCTAAGRHSALLAGAGGLQMCGHLFPWRRLDETSLLRLALPLMANHIGEKRRVRRFFDVPSFFMDAIGTTIW